MPKRIEHRGYKFDVWEQSLRVEGRMVFFGKEVTTQELDYIADVLDAGKAIRSREIMTLLKEATP